jgi:hypothetical protein
MSEILSAEYVVARRRARPFDHRRKPRSFSRFSLGQRNEAA